MAQVCYSKSLNEQFLLRLKQELKENFKDCRQIAIKIHFGEPGNKTSFKPEDIMPIINLLKELNFGFFLYDSPVAYSSPRNNPITHKVIALKKGWGKLGKLINKEDFIEAKGKNLTYQVCKPLTSADGVLVITHLKGHICSGFGGAIKNLGMGALTKKTKKDIHAGGEPIFEGECTQCKSCELACPLGTLKVKDKPIFGTCYGCSNCVYACPNNLIKPKVNNFDILLAEGASLAQKNFKKVYYISFLKNITKECDCERNPKEIIAKDCGFLLSKDGVAIDKAAYDIITKNSSEDVFLKHNKKSGLKQVQEAERFGMGSQDYELKNL